MKSITVKDKWGNLLIKVIHRKNGEYELVKHPDIQNDFAVEVRDDKNCKVTFGGHNEIPAI